MKKLWLSSIYLCSGVLYCFDGMNSLLSSGNNRLDNIELKAWQKYSELESKKNDDQAKKIGERIGFKVEQIQKKRVLNGQSMSEALNIIYQELVNDPELTVFTKEVFRVCAHEFATDNFEKFANRLLANSNMDNQEKLELIKQYMPQEKNLVPALVNFAIWRMIYMKSKLAENNTLSVDDIIYPLQHFADVVKLPKKSHRIWQDIVVAAGQTIKELPEPMVTNLLDVVKNGVQIEEQLEMVSLLQSISAMRNDLMNRSENNISEEEYHNYEAFLGKWAQCQSLIHEATFTPLNQAIYSKMLFKN